VNTLWLRSVVLGLAVCSCVRRAPQYTCVNELDLPGHCPPPGPPPELVVRPEEESSAGEFHGRVFSAQSQGPIRNATVWILDEVVKPVYTDSLGAFHARTARDRLVIRTAMIGYRSRTDTVALPARGGLRIAVPLVETPFDGPCSGYEMVCQPR